MYNMFAISYLKTALRQLQKENKEISTANLEKRLNKLINEDKKDIIAYAKIALYTLKNSANDITEKELERTFRTIQDLYPSKEYAIERAKKL